MCDEVREGSTRQVEDPPRPVTENPQPWPAWRSEDNPPGFPGGHELDDGLVDSFDPLPAVEVVPVHAGLSEGLDALEDLVEEHVAKPAARRALRGGVASRPVLPRLAPAIHPRGGFVAELGLLEDLGEPRPEGHHLREDATAEDEGDRCEPLGGEE